MPPEVNPRLVFERLFGPAEASDDPATRAKRQRYEKSILDFVREDTKKLKGELGPTDRRTWHEGKDTHPRPARWDPDRLRGACAVDVRPAGPGFPDRTDPNYDLHAGPRGQQPHTYREIGAPDAHHGLSHHKGDGSRLYHSTVVYGSGLADGNQPHPPWSTGAFGGPRMRDSRAGTPPPLPPRHADDQPLPISS